MTSKVLPLLVRRDDRPFQHLTVLNSGSIRFDIFKGEFTRNDQVGFCSFGMAGLGRGEGGEQSS